MFTGKRSENPSNVQYLRLLDGWETLSSSAPHFPAGIFVGNMGTPSSLLLSLPSPLANLVISYIHSESHMFMVKILIKHIVKPGIFYKTYI